VVGKTLGKLRRAGRRNESVRFLSSNGGQSPVRGDDRSARPPRLQLNDPSLTHLEKRHPETMRTLELSFAYVAGIRRDRRDASTTMKLGVPMIAGHFLINPPHVLARRAPRPTGRRHHKEEMRFSDSLPPFSFMLSLRENRNTASLDHSDEALSGPKDCPWKRLWFRTPNSPVEVPQQNRPRSASDAGLGSALPLLD